MDIFWQWVTELIRDSNGAVFVGGGAFSAGALALLGAFISVQSANKRTIQNDRHHKELMNLNRRDQEALDLRERESSRNARFFTLVEQMASAKEAARMGGLYSLAALADEWDQEARRLLDGQVPSPAADDKRTSLPLQRENVNAIASSAIGQRDACIGLVCAYLRTLPVGQDPNEDFLGPMSLYDQDARKLAVSIITQHLKNDAQNPWPGSLINLQGADLRSHEFMHCNLQGSTFRKAHMNNVIIAETKLDSARLFGVNLDHATVSNSSFTNTYFDRANLHGVIILSSNFTNANFTGTNIEYGGLHDSNFTGARFSGANLASVRMGGSIFGDKWQDSFLYSQLYGGASLPHWNDRTEWPDYFDPQQILELAVKIGCAKKEETDSWIHQPWIPPREDDYAYIVERTIAAAQGAV